MTLIYSKHFCFWSQVFLDSSSYITLQYVQYKIENFQQMIFLCSFNAFRVVIEVYDLHMSLDRKVDCICSVLQHQYNLHGHIFIILHWSLSYAVWRSRASAFVPGTERTCRLIVQVIYFNLKLHFWLLVLGMWACKELGFDDTHHNRSWRSTHCPSCLQHWRGRCQSPRGRRNQ